MIELLVVVAIIALLLSVLLPSLSGARESARRAACVANLHGIALAGHMYSSADRHEMAIPVHERVGTAEGAVGEYEWGGKAGAGEPVMGTDPVASKWGTQYGRGPASRALNRVVYKSAFADFANDPGPNQTNWLSDSKLDLGIYKCPSDRGYAGHHYTAWRDSGLTSYDHYGTSYAASACWVGPAAARCQIYSNTVLMRPMPRVVSPARTTYFLENAGMFAWRNNFGTDECAALSADSMNDDIERPVKGWHGKPWQFAMAFADGHAEFVKIQGHHIPQPTLSYYPKTYETSLSTYDTYHCITIRGDGWQIDTLPAPPIQTSFECRRSGVLVNPIG